MDIILNPKKDEWPKLTKRPVQDNEQLSTFVAEILNKVRKDGDWALKELTLKFDKVGIYRFRVSEDEFKAASLQISAELEKAIDIAIANIEKFHRTQIVEEAIVETSPGVFCWRKNVAIDKVGLYIPGGSAPLFSTVLMLGIPAKLAGCNEIILCTPPDPEGKINPAILFAASKAGISKIYKVGGAQAIAAMIFGTESISKVDKIFGPGNQYVTEAKQQAPKHKVAIDMPAGPSEVLVLADETADPSFIAADLLSQAEHGPDSQVILATDQATLMEQVKVEVDRQLNVLPRKEIAAKALDNSKLILFENMDDALDFSNLYAPEHLIIMVKDLNQAEKKIKNAGSVFLGNYTPEAAGDYASGTNHVLPTNSHARNYSGVGMDSFMKKISFQKISKEGLQKLGPAIEVLAEAEQLTAHKSAVSIRLSEKGS